MDQEELNERETRAWIGFQRMRIEVNEVLARRLARDFGLTEADFVVLLRLSRIPEHRLRARDLAAALHWERSRLSRQISRMETRGTVARAPSEGDARGYDVVMTDEGLAAFQSAWPAWVEGIRHCFADVLSPEQLDSLAAIAEAIDVHYNAQHYAAGLNGSAETDGACAEAADGGSCNEGDVPASADPLESAC